MTSRLADDLRDGSDDTDSDYALRFRLHADREGRVLDAEAVANSAPTHPEADRRAFSPLFWAHASL
ncbi:hypothetical protein [Nonomuraea roseola]|uniref:Uncharacterized protein n=1 Tax=Nonomuraea roseola TaxID=46179 RepID=A0ABV5Q4G0_9ACTN